MAHKRSLAWLIGLVPPTLKGCCVEHAFHSKKKKPCVLALCTFVVDCDASGIAIGAVLTQDDSLQGVIRQESCSIQLMRKRRL